jgi:hypothetical protein
LNPILWKMARMLLVSRLFYVQDERYVTDAWMRKSDGVQDERYVTDAWMRKSDGVQDEQAVFLPLGKYRHYSKMLNLFSNSKMAHTPSMETLYHRPMDAQV